MTPEEKKAAEEAKKAAKEAVQQLEKEAELRKRIAESSGEYVKLMKDLKNLNKDINTVTQQIEQVTARLATTLTPEQTAIETEKLNILQEQLAVLNDTQKTYTKVIKETNKYAKSLAALGMAAKDVKSIYSTISGGYSKFKSWSGLFEVDKSIRTASTSMGLLGTRSDMFRKNLQLAAGQTTIFGADIKELAEIQGTFSDELGRASLLSSEALVSIAKIGRGTGIGAEGAAKMAADFENQGISAERTAKFIQQVVDDTSRMGINSSKVVKNIQQNVKLLNKYNFKDGAKGLAKMAERAAKLGIDMNITSSMAEKLFDLEGAVDMSAQLQVLGGEWSKLADPFKLMYMARNDMDGLEESVINATTASATFNEKNGEFEIGAMEMQRLRKVAEAANLDFEKLADTAKKTAKAVGKRNQIRYNFDPETKEFIENTSTLNEKGEAVIQLQSGSKLVKQLNQADKSAIEAAIKEKASLEKRAQEALTFDETLSNVVIQFKQLLLPFLEAFDTAFRPVAVKLAEVLSDKNVLKGIAETAKIAADLMGFVGKFIAENPLKSIAIAIGGLGLFEVVKWTTMGFSFGSGFMASVTGSGFASLIGTGFAKVAGPILGISIGTMLGKSLGKNISQKLGNKDTETGDISSIVGGVGLGAAGWALGAALAPATGGLSLLIPAAAALGGATIGSGAGKVIGDYAASDAVFTAPISDGMSEGDYYTKKFGTNYTKKRGIIDGGKITPIDNKDDILAMKPGGIVDKVMSKNTGVNTVKHEFGTLNISGEITLNVPGNEKININLAKSPEFVREITRMVHVEAAKIKNQIQKG